jgi:hypothetical protein
MQHQLLRDGDALLERRALRADGDRLVVQLEAREGDRRDVSVLGDALRLEQVEALGAAEEDRAVACLEIRAGVELTALQPVGDGVDLRLLRGGV